MLSRDEILAADDLPTEVVSVEEWGGKVIVRGLTARERDAYDESVLDMRGNKAKVKMENIRAELVARCVVDEEGKRVFSDADAKALGKKSAVVVNRLWDVARRLSGMTEEAVEEAEETFAEGQDESSSSG